MALEPHSRIYSRTAAGDEALASGDVAIPSDYRRILAVIETSTHTHVIRGRLRHFADELLEDWLAELEELGFISSITADVTQDLDFSSLLEAQRQSVRQAPPDDSQRLGIRAAQAAFDELGQKGVFLAADRIRHRPPLAKRASETCVLPIRKPKKSWRYHSRISAHGNCHWLRISGTAASSTVNFKSRLTGTASRCRLI